MESRVQTLLFVGLPSDSPAYRAEWSWSRKNPAILGVLEDPVILNGRLNEAIKGKTGQDKIDAINDVLKEWAEVSGRRT